MACHRSSRSLPSPRPRHRLRWPAAARIFALTLALVGSAGCSVRQLAVRSLGDAFVASGDVYASDDDPELVRQALPFALKTMETLLAEAPENRQLLLAACQGFTQYAYAFVEADAERLEITDYRRSQELRERALKLYLRARGYCFTDLELGEPGTVERLRLEPAGALAGFGRGDVPLLYWSGASWGAAIAAGADRPELVADLGAVEALLERALELDESYDRGAIHEAMIPLAALSPAAGGSFDEARRHYERAVELGGGLTAGPHVTLAASVSVATQNRDEFERLLHEALAVDPDRAPARRLANLVAQERARRLLERTDELFLE